jgi:hypothetical protein
VVVPFHLQGVAVDEQDRPLTEPEPTR